MLNFLAGRAVLDMKKVENGKYSRTMHLAAQEKNESPKQLYGWLCIGKPENKDDLLVTVAASPLPVLPQVLAKVRNLFDLYC
ncbi:MAG: hypothetical protein LBU32_21830 [Clostridiales bacterium]|nr:hypothetical protein [Clostridiales bacterium]